MKKRFLCMFLCIMLVLSAILTSCNDKKDDDSSGVNVEELSESCVTVTLYLMYNDVAETEEEKAAAAAARDEVEKEFTKITKSRFKINVDIIYLTEDEYYEKVEGSIKASVEESNQREACFKALKQLIRAEKKKGNTDEAAIRNTFFNVHPEWEKYRNEEEEEEVTQGEEETIRNELGVVELKYPETKENQVDIIFINGYDKYMQLIKADDGDSWLAPLDEQLENSAKKLKNYISAALLNGVKMDGSTYAIPNNVAIGEYTFMMIDKDMFDECYGNYEDVKSVLDLKDFFADLSALYPVGETHEGSKYPNGVVPINSTFDDCMKDFVWYWTLGYEEFEGEDVDANGKPVIEYSYNFDTTNKFSVLGALYNGPDSISRGKIELGFESLFTNSQYRDLFLKLKAYEFNNYFGSATEEVPAAVTFQKGDYAIKDAAEKNNGVYVDENGKEYYAIVVRYPEADEQSLYGNMFGVNAFSEHVFASMTIITAINTDAELRNLLQYGIEGQNYEIDEVTGVLRRLNHNYMMDIEKTGNCFIAYPEEGQPANYWDNAKKQNNESLINPLMGFDFDTILEESDTKLDNDLIKYTNILTSDVLKKIEACETIEELDKLLNTPNSGLCDSLKPVKNPTIEVEYENNGKLEIATMIVNLKKMTNKNYDCSNSGDEFAAEPVEDLNGESPYKVYYEWLSQYGYLPGKK